VSERTVTEEEVRLEHLAEVRQALHWAYIALVLLGGLALMVLLLWVLGGST
jgi:hypothetical protein